MDDTKFQAEGLNILDSVYGVVSGECKNGLFLLLENGQKAFAAYSKLSPGTRVLCTVFKPSCSKRKVTVAIDAVLDAAQGV